MASSVMPPARPMPSNCRAFGGTSDMSTILEDAEAVQDFTTNKDGPPPLINAFRGRLPRAARPSSSSSFSSFNTTPTYSMSPGHKIPTSRSLDSVPKVLNRPRKLSTSSSASSLSSVRSRESIGGFSRSSSCSSSSTTFDSIDSEGVWSTKKPFRVSHSVTTSLASSRTPPPDMFATLSTDILEHIVAQLRLMHLGENSDSCATCWMRDLCSLSLCSHRWSTVARTALYEDIQLIGSDSSTHRKRFKLNQGARMLMLRRTLRSNPYLAAIVRSLKLPRSAKAANTTNSKTSAPHEQYDDLVASLLMACPNLERLYGPTTIYDHSFKRVHHALSTRSQLRRMDWVIEPSQRPSEKKKRTKTSRDETMTPGELHPLQSEAFLALHDQWTHLETLSIQCLPGATLAPDTLLTRIVDQLPSLRHLHLCNLSSSSFNDSNLLSLPALESLTLSNIPGVTVNGLSVFATGASSSSLRDLHLRHTPVTEVQALVRILANLKCLTTLSVVQNSPPLMPIEEGLDDHNDCNAFTLCMMPYLASASLRKLHWDITSSGPSLTGADDVLSRSIAAGGFPSLRRLRAPNDPEGVFQDLCRPRFKIDLSHDRYHNTLIQRAHTEPATKPSMKLLRRSPTDISPSVSPLFERPPPHTNLCAARLAAQARLELARSKPRFQFNILEEDGSCAESFGLGGYLGTQGSLIEYHLLPDANSTDEKGGLLDVADMHHEDGEELLGGRAGCTGKWNIAQSSTADRPEQERWWHTERGRWSAVLTST